MAVRLPGFRTALAASPAVFAFALYLRTLARHGDSGNGPMLAVAADELGVPGWSGHPLYVIVAHAVLRWLPVGEPILRTTLLSALTAALAVGVLGIVVYRLTKRWWAGAFAGLLFGVSDALWSQAVVTEIHGLSALLAACTLGAALAWLRARSRAALTTMAASLALWVTCSPVALTWVPMVLAALVLGSRGPRRLPRKAAAIAVVAGLIPLVLLALPPAFVHRDPVVNFASTGSSWLDPPAVTWQTRWRAVVDYFGFPEEHVREGYLLTQYGLSVLWLAPLGIWVLGRWRRDALAVTFLAYVVPVAWIVGAGVRDPGSLYLGSHMVVLAWIGMGARIMVFAIGRLLRKALRERRGRTRIRNLVIAGLIALPFFVMMGNYAAIDRSRTQAMTQLGRALLDRAERDAVIIVSGDDWTYPALYVQRLERRRPDVLLLLDRYFRWPNMRLIERERKRGLVVRPPRCGHVGGELRSASHAWCCIHQVIWDNYARRTVYIAGPLADLILRTEELREKLPECAALTKGLAMIEFVKPPADAPLPEVPEPPVLQIEPASEHEEHPHHGHEH